MPRASCDVAYQNRYNATVANAVSITLNAPSGFSAGDLFIAHVAKDDDDPITIPSGWTLIQNGTGGTACSFSVSYRIAEAGDTSWDWTGDREGWAGVILRYTGHNATGFIYDSGVSTGSDINPLAPNVTFTGLPSGSLAVQSFGADDDDEPYTTPSPLTERWQGASVTSGMAVGDNPVDGTGGTGTASFTMQAGEEWVAVTLVIRAEVTGNDYILYPTQSLTWSSTVVREGIFYRSASQSVTWASTVARILEATRSASQGLSWDSTVSKEFCAIRYPTQSISWASTVNREIIVTRSITQSITWSSTTAREGIFHRSASQSVTWTSSTSVVKEMVISASQSISWSSTVSREIDATRSASQSISWSSTVDRLGVFTRSSTQSINWSSTVARIYEPTRSASQGLSWDSTVSKEYSAIRYPTQSISWASTTNREIIATRSATQSISWSSTVDRLGVFTRSSTQSLSWSSLVIVNKTSGGVSYTRYADVSLNWLGVAGRVMSITRSAIQSLSWSSLVTADIPSGNAPPTDTALEITDPSDGVYILAGSGIGYTFRMVGTDVDGGTDISSLHGSLVFDEHFRLNVSLSGATVSFPEGEDYVVHGGTTIATSGNTKTVDLTLTFTEQTPSVNNIDGYLQVTDSSNASSGWTEFTDIITTMLYEEGGGGGGGIVGTPSELSTASSSTVEEAGLLPAPDTFIVITQNPEMFNEEYLIEVKNPLSGLYINAVPIPWMWTSAQKIVVIWFLGVVIFMSLGALYLSLKKRKKRKKRKNAVFVNPILKIKY